MDSRKAVLDAFGALLMERVRDAAIRDSDILVSGQSQSVTGVRVRSMIAGYDAQQLDALRRLIPIFVDTTLHHLLWALEQVDRVDVTVRINGEASPSLRELSDGLAGELYDWIPRFSKERYEPVI